MNEPLNLNSAVEALNKLQRPTEEPTEAIEPEVEELADDAQSDIESDIDAESDTDETQVEPEPSEPEVVAEPGAEEVELEADQLAEILGVKQDQLEVSDDGKLMFKAKVNGEVRDVNLTELINAHQGNAELTNRSKEISALRKQSQEKLAEYDNHATMFAQTAAHILSTIKDAFVQAKSDEELQAIREDDPGEYAAIKQDIRTREQRFNDIANEAVKAVQDAKSLQNTEYQSQYQQWLSQQSDSLREAVPNWEEVESENTDYMRSIGFTDQEIGQFADARLLIMINKARQFDLGKQNVQKKLKKPMPKVLKPGAKRNPKETQITEAQKQRQKLKQSGSVKDAALLFKHMRG